jgi:Protein of unknown function (DUF2721)
LCHGDQPQHTGFAFSGHQSFVAGIHQQVPGYSANVVRKLHEDYLQNKNRENSLLQILNLKKRLRYIRLMQGAGVFSFLLCVICMYSIYNGWMVAANFIFATSLLSLLFSLLCSLIEIFQSLNALEVLLKDLED